mmetsp:Transcript_7722/g.11463  ORF Transcript_7722/g.11463 Transcript_7722/m.11463 type:complete len:419 (-) Transcript_7722:36-1292(-)
MPRRARNSTPETKIGVSKGITKSEPSQGDEVQDKKINLRRSSRRKMKDTDSSNTTHRVSSSTDLSNTDNETKKNDVIAPATPQKQGIKIQSQTASATKPSTVTALSIDDTKNDKEKEETHHLVNPKRLFSIDARVVKVYKIIQKATGALGGNGSGGGIYGELTMHSMQKVINYMIDNCEMVPSSRFIDVGSGLGKPNFHVTQDIAVRVSIGIELEKIRYQLGMLNLKSAIAEMSENVQINSEEDAKLIHGINFVHGDIFDVSSTDPFTHIYMYDVGFPSFLHMKIAEYFNNSTHAQYMVSYRPPRRIIKEFGYQVIEIGSINTSMTGSGEKHTAYFYKRTNTPAPCIARPNTSILRIPPRPGSSEQPVDVVCADKFKECIDLAVGPLEECTEYVNAAVNTMISSARPKRERHQRVLRT